MPQYDSCECQHPRLLPEMFPFFVLFLVRATGVSYLLQQLMPSKQKPLRYADINTSDVFAAPSARI